MTCNIVARYINTDIATKLLNYEHQIQNNIQWNLRKDISLRPSFIHLIFFNMLHFHATQS